MRDVVAPLQIPRLFKCRQSCPHTRFHIRNRIIPTSFTCNLQRRATNPHPLFGHIFHSPPHLLYLTDAKFGLVKQHEMLVKVAITIEHVTPCLKMRITSSTSSLLHIILKRVGNIIMDDQPHIALINSHSESRSRNNDAHTVIHERFLIGNLLICIHLPVERQSFVTITGQLLCQQPCSLRARYIYYNRTV